MKFGMPTLIEIPSLTECALLCRELDLDFIELNMNLPAYQTDRLDPAMLRKIADTYGVFFTLHLDENLNFSDFNPLVAQAWRRTALDTIALAQQADIKVLNLHLANGVYFTLPEEKVYLYARYRQRYLESVIQFRDACTAAASDADLKICIENCDGFRDFHKEAIGLLLQSPVFGLTFDIGHSHACGGVDEGLIFSRADRLVHMHLHDAVGKKNHLPLGAGEIEPDRFFALGRQCGCTAVLETKTAAGLRESVTWLHAHHELYSE